MTRETGKKIIEAKISDFEKNALVLKKKGHGETNIRTNYIDVLFEALGWNMKSHYEVVREFSQKDNSATKKVDYAFKVNGKLKFFIEAKEASVDLVKDKDAIHQAKRYAYSTNGRAPIVILTDFEEFRVFNVIKAPDYNNTDRELLKKYSMKYSDYLNNWDLLWNTFSKEAVTAGSLEVLRGKIDKNTKTMDVDFLEQITGWREDLARNIAIRNKDLKVDELNEAVQRILDRLLFIRNLEDREIEPENTLLDKTKKADNIYKIIIPIFNNLDNVYNGLLFKKHFSEELIVDDKTIKDIIKSMCYPVSPFQFDVIEPEILGRIYEKFLGSKIRLTENHQAKIEEKIEVRKAGGVYYTPEYIVHYIVENTVGKKIAGLNPEEIKKIKIVDPACGSGSFLLGAYSSLLDYHAKWYASASPSDRKKYKADFYTTNDGELKVNLEKRGAILRDNIFGVDIDKEATEVAIMSLYLKMLDDGFDKGERDLFFIKGHVLPDMTDNIKCGNSLIGTDYFDGKLEIDIEEMKEVKPFDWRKEFSVVFNNGGFDCVIGNPPYLGRATTFSKGIKNYIDSKYSSSEGKYEIYHLFMEKSSDILSHEGYFSFITPQTWLTIIQATKLRKQLFEKLRLEKAVYFVDKVFPVSVDSIITVFRKSNKDQEIKVYKINNIFNDDILNPISVFDHNSIFTSENHIIDLFGQASTSEFIGKINSCSITLDSFNYVKDGIKVVGPAKDFAFSEVKTNESFFPMINGKSISKYFLQWNNLYCCRDKNQIEKHHATDIRLREEFIFNRPKIVVRKTGSVMVAAYDDSNYYYEQSLFSISLMDTGSQYNIKFLLAILNSQLANYLLKVDPFSNKETFPQIRLHWLKSFAIINIDFSVKTQKEKHDSLVSIVDQMIQTQKDCRGTKSESDKKLYEQKISMLDKKIDELVYKLYGLTDEEIKIIEGE